MKLAPGISGVSDDAPLERVGVAEAVATDPFLVADPPASDGDGDTPGAVPLVGLFVVPVASGLLPSGLVVVSIAPGLPLASVLVPSGLVVVPDPPPPLWGHHRPPARASD